MLGPVYTDRHVRTQTSPYRQVPCVYGMSEKYSVSVNDIHDSDDGHCDELSIRTCNGVVRFKQPQ